MHITLIGDMIAIDANHFSVHARNKDRVSGVHTQKGAQGAPIPSSSKQKTTTATKKLHIYISQQNSEAGLTIGHAAHA